MGVGQVQGTAQLVQHLGLEGLAMDDELLRIAPSALIHQVLQVDDLRIALTLLRVGKDVQLVLAEEVGNDAHRHIGVDDGGTLRHDVLVEEELRAEAVDIADEEFVDVGSIGCPLDTLKDALLHAP